jgi:hypothetical protein
MCGRPLAFRQPSYLDYGLCPLVGAQPQLHFEADGSAERFRTSGGIAASIGVAVLATVLNDHSSVAAFHNAFAVSIVFGLLGIAFALLIHDQDAAASLRPSFKELATD